MRSRTNELWVRAGSARIALFPLCCSGHGEQQQAPKESKVVI